MKKNFKIQKGITLIALLITIIVLLILAGVVINMITDNDGVLNKATNAKFMHNLGVLREEIDLYIVNSEIEEKEGIDKYPIIKEETMDDLSEEDKNKLPAGLKSELASIVTKDGEMATIENIDYEKIYKIDSNKISSAKAFSGDLYLVEDGSEYKVISVNGEIYNKEKINIIIPLNNIEDAKYITAGNNTYKLYGDGTLKVIGEIVEAKTGITNEQINIVWGLNELDLDEIDEEGVIRRDSNVDTKDETAKAYGVKKIYIAKKTAYIIDANDDLWAWGDNSYNKLGQGNSYLVTEPTKILEGKTEGITGVKAKNVWAEANNTFVLDTENRLWACGNNSQGILGQGNTNTYNNFVQVNIGEVDFNIVEIEKIEVSAGYVLIKCNNGKIYGCGSNVYGNLGQGDYTQRTTFFDLGKNYDIWNNVEDVKQNGEWATYILKDGVLYGCGNGYGTSLIKIEENVEKFKYFQEIGWAIVKKDGKIYLKTSKETKQINSVEGTDVQIGGNGFIKKEDKIYSIANDTIITRYDKYEIKELLDAIGFVGKDNKIYLDEYPDIVKPKGKAIISLKEVLEGKNIAFVQGSRNYINIVDKEGNIYENVSGNNSELKNIKKLISSNSSKYALDKEGYLYVKGGQCTGLWGAIVKQDTYQKVTKDGVESFDNIKDIFTSNFGNSVIFKTEENDIYWAGGVEYTGLPNISGDINGGGNGWITKYAKKVESTKLNEIKEKISDIKSSFISVNGIYGANTLVLTEDGKVYTYSKNANMTGNGKISSDFVELKIDGNVPVKQVETIGGFSLVLLENGEVYGWGYNTYGILGEGYEVDKVYSTPVKLNISNISYMSLGEGFAIFANKSGEVYGIGKNDYGQLGTGDTNGKDTFVRCKNLEE